MLSESEADVTYVWRIALTEFHVLAPVSLVVTAHDAVFKSVAVDTCIDADGLVVFVPMPESLAGWMMIWASLQSSAKQNLTLFWPFLHSVLGKVSIRPVLSSRVRVLN